MAIKLLVPSAVAGPEALARFQREGIAAAKIRHPSAVHVYDFGVTQGVAYLVMELLEGVPLFDEIEQQGRCTPQRVAEVVVPLCEVLAEAHAAGIVHRDVKPANIMLTKDQAPVLVDFGLGLDEGGAGGGELGVISGTPAYMAPEQVAGRVGPACDVWALGAVLYECLTGRPPFHAASNPIGQSTSQPLVLAMVSGRQR